MSRTWEDAPTRVQAPLYGPRHEPRAPLDQQALAWRIRREKAWTAAGWLTVAFLALLCAVMALVVLHIWHAGGPLTGGG